MTLATMAASEWMPRAADRLRDARACPRCAAALTDGHCPQCRADYRGAVGEELWRVSLAAAEALDECRRVVERIPLLPAPALAPVAPVAEPVAETVTPALRSSATVQSVLAVAGAGLVAIAALVFTFFNPDLRDPLARGVIVAAVSVVFLLGARWLARRGLRFSAEAVGALALVFLALDIHALTGLAPRTPWTIAAMATAGASAVMIAGALRTGIRVWLWSALTALAVVPSLLGVASAQPALWHFASAVAAFALIAAAPGLGRRFGAPLRAEAVTLTVLQLLALATILVQGWLFGAFPSDAAWAWLCAALAASAVLALFSSRHPAGGLWSALAGGFGAAAFVALPAALTGADFPDAAIPAVMPTAAVIGAIVWARVLPVPRAVRRTGLAWGALVVAFMAVLPVLLLALLVVIGTVLGVRAATDEGGTIAAASVGLASTALGLVLFGRLARRVGFGWATPLGAWVGVLAALTVLSVPDLALWSRVTLGIVLGAGVAGLVARGIRTAAAAVRLPLVVGAHLLIALAALLSWRDAELVVPGGVAVVLATTMLAMTVPTGIRFLHVAAGYAYGLLVFATALSQIGVGGVALLCLTTASGAVVAIAATFTPRVTARSWYAVLVVTTVPFLLGVLQVVFERSGWTALSTGLIFLLALALIVTRRAGLGVAVRLAAAGVLVPSLAVVAVCLGAQLLPGSGSPVVLPVIAVVVALVLPAGPLIQTALTGRTGERDAALVRIPIEASTLLTAAIAVLLALVRDAAGLPTTILVLVVLAVGGAATSVWGRRRYGWWLAALAGTGALWCGWALAGVTLVEPYLLPPALGAALVGLVLTFRGARGLALYAAGLLLAVVPFVVLSAVGGPTPRALAVVGASWVLVLAQALLARGPARGRLEALRPVTGAAAIVAGSAGAVLGARLGLGLEESDLSVPLVLVCLMAAAAGAVPAAFAGRMLRHASAARIAHSEVEPSEPHRARFEPAASRWTYAPVVVYLTAGAWAGIRRDWFTIWTMWALLIAVLVLLVVAARREVRGRPGLPPAWFLFALAFVTAVVAWSPRDLRVEWFSLPLGAAVVVAGALALRAPHESPRRAIAAWPAGWSGSWSLLGPGIVLTLAASVASTFTDPLTWRAILVIVLALVAILVGAARRWAAPFLLGIIVLPVENAIAFLVQIGRGIDSMPWWITLAVVGAVLLIIAVTYERRTDEHTGFAARLRDLA